MATTSHSSSLGPRSTAHRGMATTIALDQALLIVRLVWVLCVLFLLSLPVLAWADLEWTPPASLLQIVQGIVGIGAAVTGLELGIAAFRLVRWTGALSRATASYLRIRTPNPQVSTGTLGENQPNGADLWYALHRLLPEVQNGSGAWMATTLSARPDEPVEFGAVIGGGTREQHDSWLRSLRQIVIGHNSESVVDSVPDPLHEALDGATGSQEAVLTWAEYALRYSPAFPLRMPTDADADLIGPLVALIRPRAGAVRYTEVQVVTQPRHDWRGDTLGWRAAAYRRLNGMRARAAQVHGTLSADGRALDAKMDSPAFTATVRVVAVAHNRTHAERLLREVDTVLGQYSDRSGHVFQRLSRAGRGIVPLGRVDRASLSALRLGMLAGVGSIVLGCVGLLWPAGALPPLALLYGVGCLVAPALALAAWDRARRGARTEHWRARLAARAPRLEPPQNLLLLLPAWKRPAVLSAGELGGIWHLPSPNLGVLARWLPCRHISAPPHAFISTATILTPTGQTSRRIALGYAVRSDGERGKVGPSLYDLRNIMHTTAGMGGGKSRLFANIAVQLLGTGMLLIDGKGDDAGNLTMTVRNYVGLSDEQRLVLLDIKDTDWPISLNPLAGVSIDAPGAIDRVTAQIQSIFARLDPEGWQSAPGMQQFLDMGTRLVVETVPLPTVAHVKQALIDETYRAELLSTCRKLEVRTFWEVIYPSSSDQQKTSMNALMRRFDRLLLSDLVRSLMSQEQPTFRFEEAIRENLIVLCPIPHVTYGPLAATAAMLMFQSFLRAAFDRPGTAATRADYPLIIDEFQVLVEQGASQDVAVALTQLRSLGIPTMYAHQALSQIGDLRDVMLVNAENRLMIRTQEPDAGTYASHYSAAGISGADITSQEPSDHQYARFLVGGKPVGPISIQPLPWPPSITVLVDQEAGPDWQTIVPNDHLPLLPGPVEQRAARLSSVYDSLLIKMIYHTPYTDDFAMSIMETLTDEVWYLMNSRWEAIARVQRQYILDHPGCIPDRFERQRWLSRLAYARPRLLAEIEFLRIRRATGLDTLATQVSRKKDKGKSQRGGSAPASEAREHYSTNKNVGVPAEAVTDTTNGEVGN